MRSSMSRQIRTSSRALRQGATKAGSSTGCVTAGWKSGRCAQPTKSRRVKSRERLDRVGGESLNYRRTAWRQGALRMEEFHRIRRLPPYVFEPVNRVKAAARNAGAD